MSTDPTPAPVEAPARIKVRVADIQPFAKKNCRRCFGAGEFYRLAGKGPADSARRITTPCRCALNRFLAAQPCVRDEGTGQLFFDGKPKHRSPISVAADAAVAPTETP